MSSNKVLKYLPVEDCQGHRDMSDDWPGQVPPEELGLGDDDDDDDDDDEELGLGEVT